MSQLSEIQIISLAVFNISVIDVYFSLQDL